MTMTDDRDSTSAPIPAPKDFINKIFSLIEAGQTFHAYDIGKKALELYPDNDTIKQGVALSLLRTGAVSEAKNLITPVLQRTYKYQPLEITDEYIANSNYLALIFKESWYYSRLTDDLEVARNLYQQSFKLRPNTTTGVSAAALSWMIGEDETCQQLAHGVLALHDRKLSNPDFRSYSDAAQALLLLGDIDAALSLYNKAIKHAPKGYSAIVELREALLFLQRGGFSVPEQCFKILPAPVVVVFSGQMLDPYDQVNPTFSFRLEPFVRAAIEGKLDEINAQIGYSSASCGADLLFIEAMLNRDAEVNIILPFVAENFLEERVRYAGPRWERRFTQALKNAHSVQYATHDYYLGHESLYSFANQVMHGTAAIRAQFLSGAPHLMAVLDRKSSSVRAGAVNDFIQKWHDVNSLHVIDLDEISQDAGYKSAQKQEIIKAKTEVLHSAHYSATKANKSEYLGANNKQNGVVVKYINPSINSGANPAKEIDFVKQKEDRLIKFLLFSDLAGYSKLQDQHIPGFLKFLNELEQEMRNLPYVPESINTWGDAVFVVMNRASELAEYALSFCDIVDRLGAKIYAFPTQIRARISLHAGPVYTSVDPFLQKNNYYGSHINRAARLEPVTVVGQVYATQQFVALLGAEQSAARYEAEQKGILFRPKFATEYVGSISLAKNFGIEPIYHLRHR